MTTDRGLGLPTCNTCDVPHVVTWFPTVHSIRCEKKIPVQALSMRKCCLWWPRQCLRCLPTGSFSALIDRMGGTNPAVWASILSLSTLQGRWWAIFLSVFAQCHACTYWVDPPFIPGLPMLGRVLQGFVTHVQINCPYNPRRCLMGGLSFRQL